jgi:hypothetical protein
MGVDKRGSEKSGEKDLDLNQERILIKRIRGFGQAFLSFQTRFICVIRG